MGKGSQNHKRRKSGPRTASGRLSRSKDAIEARKTQAFEEGPQQTVLQARRRHKVRFAEPKNSDIWREKMQAPVSKKEAKAKKLNQRGSVLGCMLADGEITREMVAAGENYCQRYLRYAALNGIPKPTAQISAYGDVRGGSGVERLAAAKAAKQEHAVDKAILTQCGAAVACAINSVCVMDSMARLSLVREGLTALVDAGR